jgi:hypothetical protein
MQLKKCDNCGAPMLADAKGCGYCGAGEPQVFDPAHLASALAQELHDVKQFADRLARMLEKAFPAHTKLEHGGWFSKELRAIAVEVKVHQYHLDVSGKHPKARRARHVRGVKLKDDELALHDWLHALFVDLAELANELRKDREALQKVVR